MLSESYYARNREKILQKRRAAYAALTPEEREKRAAKQKEWNHANAPKVRKSRLKWEKNNPTWAAYHNARRRSTDYGIPFDLHYKDLVIPSHCPILGLKLDETYTVGVFSETRPELDRIIPSLGYVKGNVQFISSRANRIKNDGTAEEHRLIAEYIEKHSQ
jgi:hypothetical protein